MALTTEVAVFVDTNLGTRLAMAISPDITARDFKNFGFQKTQKNKRIKSAPLLCFSLRLGLGELEKQHFNCFLKSGEIQVSGLMVKRKSCLYHLPDSMPMKSAFQGVKGTWFLHVEARLLSDCNRACLHKYVASKVGDHVSEGSDIVHPSNPDIPTSTVKSRTKGNCKRLRNKRFLYHKPLLGKLRRPFYLTKKRKRKKKISLAYKVDRIEMEHQGANDTAVLTNKKTFSDCPSMSEVGFREDLALKPVADEAIVTETLSDVVSVSGIITRYFPNLSEDGLSTSPTRSVTSRVVQSWPVEHLKTKEEDICSSIQVRPLTQFSAKGPIKLLPLQSPVDFCKRRYKHNKPEVGKRLALASSSLGISPSKEHPALYLLQSQR